MKILTVKVKPNSPKNEVKKLSEDFFVVMVTVSPEKNKANQKVIELLSDFLDIPKHRLEIVSGMKSKEKRIIVKDM